MFSTLLILQGCLSAETNQNDENISGQLKINRWTLLNSSDEQICIETATELLKDSSAGAREVLLDSLGGEDNPAVKISVCKAISRFRSFSKLIPKSEDFLEPLMKIISDSDTEVAHAGAQASLIFSYRQVKKYLDEIINSADSSAAAKKNAIYTLQIRPEKEALSRLIELLDSKDTIVATASGEALQQWLPVGKDRQLWRQILKELESKSRAELLRERLLAQQDKVRRLTEDIGKWQKNYIDSLEQIYQASEDDSLRAKFIAEKLTFEYASVRFWAIEKIDTWRKSGKDLPFELLQKPLLALVSDNDVTVRTSAVKLLGLLTKVNSADVLFTQLKSEKQDSVKIELLVSLGRVCNFALSPGAEIKIDSKLRTETLKIAAEFLAKKDPAAAAGVIRNLLLQNGLDDEQVRPYFELIAEMFSGAKLSQLRAGLLDEMARLCGSDSHYKQIAGKIFQPVFTAAVDDKDNQIAEPAVVGIVRIDRAGAFELLKSKGFAAHSSHKIRGQLVSIAGQIGTQDDLEWLGLIVSSAEQEEHRREAAEAMMNIFQHCKAEVLLKWTQRFISWANSQNDDFMFSRAKALLEMAEKKAEADQNAKLLFDIRTAAAEYYCNLKLYGTAAKYYGILLQSAKGSNQVSQIRADLLDVHLRAGQTESAKQLVSAVLLSSDIAAESKIANVLTRYFQADKNSAPAKKTIASLAAIKIADDMQRPQWKKQIDEWKKMLGVKPAKKEDAVIADSNTPAKQ